MRTKVSLKNEIISYSNNYCLVKKMKRNKRNCVKFTSEIGIVYLPIIACTRTLSCVRTTSEFFRLLKNSEQKVEMKKQFNYHLFYENNGYNNILVDTRYFS